MRKLFKYALMFAFVGIAIFALSQMSDNAIADTHSWDGGGTDNKASTAANWIGDVAPESGDELTISYGSKNCILDCASIGHTGTIETWGKISGNYTGTIYINETFEIWGNIAIKNSNMEINADISFGYLTFDEGNIYQNKHFINNGGNNVVIGNWYDTDGNNKVWTKQNYYILNDLEHSSNINVTGILQLNGYWSSSITYTGTSDISTNKQHWNGWLYTQNDFAIEYNAYAYLAFQHDTWLGIQLESWSGTDNFTWNATSVASQTVQWSWSRGESSAMYDEYQDGIYIGSDETNAGGIGTFTSTFVGSHAFLLSRSSFLPASTDISDDVWLGIIFMSIATLITLFGYVRRIGLVMIISFLLLVIGTLASTQIWVELWTLPTLFILVNAVLMIHGLLRKV